MATMTICSQLWLQLLHRKRYKPRGTLATVACFQLHPWSQLCFREKSATSNYWLSLFGPPRKMKESEFFSHLISECQEGRYISMSLESKSISARTVLTDMILKGKLHLESQSQFSSSFLFLVSTDSKWVEAKVVRAKQLN